MTGTLRPTVNTRFEISIVENCKSQNVVSLRVERVRTQEKNWAPLHDEFFLFLHFSESIQHFLFVFIAEQNR